MSTLPALVFFFSCCFYKDNGWVLFIIFKDYKKETPLRWCGNISTVPRHRICDRYAYAMALFVKRIWLKFNLLWFLSVGLSHDGIAFVPAFLIFEWLEIYGENHCAFWKFSSGKLANVTTLINIKLLFGRVCCDNKQCVLHLVSIYLSRPYEAP